MNYVALFFAGAFLCNCIPHLISGLRGDPFPSPFAKPPGKGNSSPLVNFLWGSFNLLVGLVLLPDYPVPARLTPDFIVLAAGFGLMGVMLAWHFGKVRGS